MLAVIMIAGVLVGCVPDPVAPPNPGITSVSPRFVPRGGDTVVIVTGSAFTPTSTVSFSAGLTAVSTRFVDASHLEVGVSDDGADPTAALDLTVSDAPRVPAVCVGCVRILGEQIAPAAETVVSIDEADGVTSLILAGSTGGLPQPPDRGDVVGLGPTDASPPGFLGRVVGTAPDGGNLKLQLIPAAVTDIAPSGALSITGPLTPPAPSPVAGRAASLTSPLAKSFQANASCEGEGAMEVSGEIDLDNALDFDLEWEDISDPITKASVSVTTTESLTLQGSVTGTASCRLDETAILPKPLLFSPKVVFVGFVPIVIVPTLQLYVSAEATADGALTMGLSQEFTATAGLEYADRQVRPVANYSNSFDDDPPQIEASANAGVTLSARIGLLISGLDGPEINLDGGAEIEAELGAPPCWALSGTLAAGAQLKVPLTNLTLGRPDLWSDERTVAEDTDGVCPPPDTTTTEPDQSTTTTTEPEPTTTTTTTTSPEPPRWTGSVSSRYAIDDPVGGSRSLQGSSDWSVTVNPDGSNVVTWSGQYHEVRPNTIGGDDCVIDSTESLVGVTASAEFEVSEYQGHVDQLQVRPRADVRTIRDISSGCNGGSNHLDTTSNLFVTGIFWSTQCNLDRNFGSLDPDGGGDLVGSETCDLTYGDGTTLTYTNTWDVHR